MSRVCSKCGKPPADGNPIVYVNGVGTHAKCSEGAAYAGKATPIAEGARTRIEAGGSAEASYLPKRKRPDEA